MEQYSIDEYNPEVVLEVLSRSIRRKSGTKRELIKDTTAEPSAIMKEQRKMMGLSLNKLSELTGIPKSNLSAMENGNRKIGLKVARVIAEALGIHYKALV